MPRAEPSMRNRLATLLSLTFVGVAAAAFAEGPRAEPLSPGAAALLIDGRVAEPELQRWADLLTDERPRWRATAARLAAVSGAKPLTQPLVVALEKETTPDAAREEMTAIGLLAAGPADEFLFRAARRFSGAIDGDLARSLALRGPAALAFAPRLAGLSLDGDDWEAYFAWVTANGRQGLDAAGAAALSTGEPAAWAAFLGLARDTEHAVEEATLARSLEIPSAGVREASYWHLVLSAYPRPDTGSALALALAGAPEALDSAGGLALLGHEIVGRTFGRPARDRTALIEALPASDRGRLPHEVEVLRRLCGDERTAYGLARFGDAGAVESRVKADRGATPRVTRDLRARPTVMKTASEFPHDLVEDLLAASGCRLEGTAWAALEVRYGSDAKVEQMGVHSMEHLSPACRRAARVLLLASVVPGDRPPRPSGTDILLLPLSATFLSCLVESVPVEVLRGVAPDLDAEALRAVTQWRYTPTLLEGVPVPVRMTVTVNFKLR